MATMSGGECLVCQEHAVEEVPGFNALPRVTSDCRPFAAGGRLGICVSCGAVQKFPDAAWFKEIDEIYAAYFAYHQAGGNEQLVLDREINELSPRSKLIIRRMKRDVALPDRGRAIDIGCGTGGTLQAMSDELPGWRLYGQDLNTRQEERMRQIPRFERLFIDPIANLPQGFDLVSMVHSLEHFPSPRQALIDLKPKIAPHGVLFVQVVDCRRNPFDMIIADHILHFDRQMLGFLAKLAGYRAVILRDDWVLKELSLVGAPVVEDFSAAEAPVGGVQAARERVRLQLQWLDEMVDAAQRSARAAKAFGVFGTSIAGTWITGLLGDRIDFYVNEDPSFAGQSFMGKPVFHPRQVASGSTVFLALSPALATPIAARLRTYGFHTVAPPNSAEFRDVVRAFLAPRRKGSCRHLDYRCLDPVIPYSRTS